MKRFSVNKKGFTLVEETVTIVLIGILILASMGIVLSTMRILTHNIITLNAQEKGIAVMQQLEEQLKYADEAGIPSDFLSSACPYQTQISVHESSGEYSLSADTAFEQYAGEAAASGTNILCDLGSFEAQYTVTFTASPARAEVYVSILRDGTRYYAERRTIELKNDPAVSVTTINQSQLLYIGSME